MLTVAVVISACEEYVGRETRDIQLVGCVFHCTFSSAPLVSSGQWGFISPCSLGRDATVSLLAYPYKQLVVLLGLQANIPLV